MSKLFEAVTIPKWGIEMTHGRIVEWRCQEGDSISAGEEIVDIETDKIVNSFEARVSGTLVKILVAEDNELPVGSLIGVIALGPHSTAELESFTATYRSANAEDDAQITNAESEPSSPEQIELVSEIKITPALKRKLDKAGIDPQSVSGTGPNGRILKEDVERVLLQTSDDKASPSSKKMLPIAQQRVAATLSKAQTTVPLFHIRRDVSVDDALSQIQSELPNVSGLLTVMLTRAIARALEVHATLNTQFDGNALIPVEGCNVALAVARSDGAVVAPVVTSANTSILSDMAHTLSELVDRARQSRSDAEDMGSAAITLSNLGMFEVDDFTAMVTPPQIMVLSVGKIRRAPVWDEVSQRFVPERRLTLTLGSDHRVVNGAQAAQFLQSIASAIETP